ncbi:hypothetical protein TWF281_007724 [Arthrobotrys megalospora]
MLKRIQPLIRKTPRLALNGPRRSYFHDKAEEDILREALGQWKLAKWGAGIFGATFMSHLALDFSLKDRMSSLEGEVKAMGTVLRHLEGDFREIKTLLMDRLFVPRQDVITDETEAPGAKGE